MDTSRFLSLSRMDWQMRRPVLLKEAALTTTRLWIDFFKPRHGDAATGHRVNFKTLLLQFIAKEGMSAYRPSTTSREEVDIG